MTKEGKISINHETIDESQRSPSACTTIMTEQPRQAGVLRRRRRRHLRRRHARHGHDARCRRQDPRHHDQVARLPPASSTHPVSPASASRYHSPVRGIPSTPPHVISVRAVPIARGAVAAVALLSPRSRCRLQPLPNVDSGEYYAGAVDPATFPAAYARRRQSIRGASRRQPRTARPRPTTPSPSRAAQAAARRPARRRRRRRHRRDPGAARLRLRPAPLDLRRSRRPPRCTRAGGLRLRPASATAIASTSRATSSPRCPPPPATPRSSPRSRSPPTARPASRSRARRRW